MGDSITNGADDGDLSERKRSARSRAKIDRAEIEVDETRFCVVLHRFLEANVADHLWVVVYLAMADEVDLSSLVHAHRAPGARYAVTRTPDEGLALTVHPWGAPRERHRYGYSQPRMDSPQLPDGDIGAVLVPGLGFDRHGRRLGRGKGYYDRFLPRLNDTCLRIGVTGDYDPPEVPTGRFDVTMTHLAYSDRVIRVGSDTDPWPCGAGGV